MNLKMHFSANDLILGSSEKPNFSLKTWKSYNQIRKKAMEKEFSWSGLIISFSVAFFIVIGTAFLLRSINNTYISSNNSHNQGFQLSNIFYVNSAYAQEVGGYKGQIDKWTDNLEAKAGQTFEYTVLIKNIGNETWKKGEVYLESGVFLKSPSQFAHSSWDYVYRPVGLDSDIHPGETANITFKMKAPSDQIGSIQENFQLVRSNQIIEGTTLRLFIEVESREEKTVSSDSNTQVKQEESSKISKVSSNPPQIVFSGNSHTIAIAGTNTDEETEINTVNTAISVDSAFLNNIKFEEEPIIRVGIFNTESAQRISCDYEYDIFAGDEVLISDIAAGTQAVVAYDFSENEYSVAVLGKVRLSNEQIRIIPRKENAIVTLLDFDNRPAWNSHLNDNQYRNIIEFRYSGNTGKFWIINELEMSYYLKGLAETSNYSPVEYQKVIATAARTYAMYHYERGINNGLTISSTKHANEYFHVDATYDQVYKGYVSELRLTKLSEAVEETRGVVVTYGSEIVVTPYFSRSDGRTRSWEEVWYGEPKPWLKSVVVPQEEGSTLWGHGVGMSAQAALVMVRDEGEKWDDTLKYFYSNTGLQKVY